MEEFSLTKIIVSAFAVLFFLFGLGWIIQGNDFFMFNFFAPKYEQARRETFEQSKAYNEGMAQELRRMQLEFVRANPEQKQAIASLILHQFAGYEDGNLPSDLKSFMDQIKREYAQ